MPESTRKALCGAYEAALSSLDPFNGLLFLDSATLPLGEVVIVPAQDGLDVLLKIFAELSNLFLDILLCFGLRHSVFTYLSTKNPQTSVP